MWIECYALLKFVSVMNLIPISCHLFSVQERESCLCAFVKTKQNKTKQNKTKQNKTKQNKTKQNKTKQNKTLWHRQISFALSMMIGRTKLYILISLWVTLTFIEGHICMINKNIQCRFSQKFRSRFRGNSLNCHNLLVCWSSSLINFAQVLLKGENSAEVILQTIQLSLCFVGTLVNRLYLNFVGCETRLSTPVWFQREWPWCSLEVTGSQESKRLCNHYVWALYESTQMFMVVDYVREMTGRSLVWKIWVVWAFALVVAVSGNLTPLGLKQNKVWNLSVNILEEKTQSERRYKVVLTFMCSKWYCIW